MEWDGFVMNIGSMGLLSKESGWEVDAEYFPSNVLVPLEGILMEGRKMDGIRAMNHFGQTFQGERKGAKETRLPFNH